MDDADEPLNPFSTSPEANVLRDAWADGRKIQVHGWVYSLNDGLIKDLGVTRNKFESEVGAVGVD